MELHERIAAVRKAAGLTAEQLGAQLQVSAQTVRDWESGQLVPDALHAASLCRALHISADYLLLGTDPDTAEPSASAAAPYTPDNCPCCGRPVSGTICPICGFPLPTVPPRGKTYALISTGGCEREEKCRSALNKFCGMDDEHAKMLYDQCSVVCARVVLRRGLSDSAAQFLAAQMQPFFYQLRLVEDTGEEDSDVLLTRDAAMTLPPSAVQDSGIGFWGVVGAVIVALIILSFL